MADDISLPEAHSPLFWFILERVTGGWRSVGYLVLSGANVAILTTRSLSALA